MQKAACRNYILGLRTHLQNPLIIFSARVEAHLACHRRSVHDFCRMPWTKGSDVPALVRCLPSLQANTETLDGALPALAGCNRNNVHELAVLENIGNTQLLAEHRLAIIIFFLRALAAHAELHAHGLLCACAGCLGVCECEQ